MIIVWLKMALAMAAGLTLASAARAQLGLLPPISTWREYREVQDGFVVRVPNAVKAREWRDGGHPASYYLTGNTDQSFSIIAIRWPAGMRSGQGGDAVAQATAKRILAVLKPEKIERDEAQACGEGIPGRAVAANLPDKLIYTARICVTSGNVYRVETVVDAAKWDDVEPNVKAFLESFRPLRR
jgi:hypothetical protein